MIPIRLRLRLSLLVGLLLAPAPAMADPITIAIFGATFAATTAGAVVTAVITFAITSIGSLILGSLFGPKANAQDRQASVLQLSIGEHPREALLGEAATGGSLDDAFNHGGPNGTDWEVLTIIVADHRCEALTGFYVNDQFVAFAGDGPVAGFNGQLIVWWRDGQLDQVLPDVLRDEGGWGADDNLGGCATIVVAYKADDPKSTTPVWTSGRPQFLWVVKGKRCYIARKDGSLAGGSGSHRWDDPTTWEWTDNLIDCRYNWQRGIYAGDQVDKPEMLLVGRGLSAVEAPPERTFAAANLCDELVALKDGGTEKRYRINMVVRATDQFITTEEAFAAACAGDIVQREGGVEIEPGAARSVVAELTDDDIIVGEPVRFNRFRSFKQKINTVIPRYIEAAQKYADHAAPIRRMLEDVVADGGSREEPLTLIGVTSGTQAQRVGEIKRRKGRLQRSASFTLGPRFAHLEENDWVGWTSNKHLAGARVVFRIASYKLAVSWRNSISIEEIAASCFAWTPAIDEITPGAVALQQTVRSTTLLSAPSDLEVTAGAGSTTSGFRMPTEATLAYARLLRGTSTTFSAAVQVGGDIVGALGEVISVTDGGRAAGSRLYYWARAFDAAGTGGPLAGPVAVTVSYPDSTNLLTATEDFSSGSWVKASSGSGSTDPVVTANAVLAPDGTMTADAIAFTRGASGYSVIYQGGATTIGATYKLGMWLKAPSAGLSVSLRSGNTNGPALSLTTSWAYYTLTATASSTTTNVALVIWDIIGSSPTSATVHAWGAHYGA